jgi:hypothetical protein
LFDGVEIGAVGWEKHDTGLAFGQDGRHALDLVRGQVVHYQNVARPHLRREFLLDIFQEQLAIESAIDDHRSEQSVQSKRSDEGCALPMAMRDQVDDALLGWSPAIKPSHLRRAEGFVEENETTRVDARLEDLPGGPCDDNVRPILLGGVERFFFRLKPNS